MKKRNAPGTRPSTHSGWATLLILALLLLTFGLRAWLTAGTVLEREDCGGCLAVASVHHDLGLLALFFFLALAWLLLPRALALLAAALQGVLLLVIATDLVTLANFSMRLSLRDVLKFGRELQEVFGYSLTRMASPVGALALVAGLILLGCWLAWLIRLRRQRPAGAWVMALATIVPGLLYLVPGSAYHPLPWTYRNVIEVNWPSGVDRPYSEPLRSRLTAQPMAEPVCAAGDATGQDLLVVLIESWSTYHERDMGVMDATPGIDALRQRGTSWTRFFSNGFTTDHGLIALLGGVTPLPSVNRYRSLDAFGGFDDLPDSLPHRLSEDGYRSLFFTTGDLGFLDKGQWLRAIGFEHVEGSEHPFYEGQERYGFGAAHDGHLFDRVLAWYADERDPEAPFAAIVETVTTHPPFVVPDTGEQDEEQAFRFVDRELVRFVERLDAAGFFANGLLVITSDQRALTRLREAERERLGSAAAAMLPLLVLGSGFDSGGKIDVVAQMQDFPYSVDRLLTPRACGRPGQGDLLAQPARAPECVLRPQGNQRDVIDAWCAGEHARIRLDGDETRFLDPPPPGSDRLIDAVNRQRILQGDREAELAAIL